MDKVGIFNLALSVAGTKSSVSSPDEESREAEVCRLWFDTTRDQLLHAAPWPHAKAYRRLAVLAEKDPDAEWVSGDPAPGARFAYGVPSDYLRARYLDGFHPFTLGLYANATRAIMTSVERALLIYTKRQENISLWDPEFVAAMGHALGAYITLPLTGHTGRANNAAQRANDLILAARVAAVNEDNRQYDTLPDWLTARGASNPTARYYFPMGPLITVAISGS